MNVQSSSWYDPFIYLTFFKKNQIMYGKNLQREKGKFLIGLNEILKALTNLKALLEIYGQLGLEKKAEQVREVISKLEHKK